MLLIPAIDLQDGCVVRYVQGRLDKKVYSKDPVKTANFWAKQGARLLHVVDLDGAFTKGKLYAVIGAGVVGALVYTFSDTFWYSAVEAEVYAMSSLFTAVVFWAILKWESVVDEGGDLRWIVLIVQDDFSVAR